MARELFSSLVPLDFHIERNEVSTYNLSQPEVGSVLI